MPLPLLAMIAASAVAGKAAGSMGKARERANDQQMGWERNQTDRYSTNQNAHTNAYQTQQQAAIQALLGQSNEQKDHARIDLDQRQFALNAPSTRGKQALLGSLMQNMQPVKLSGLSRDITSRMPQISGGLNASALGPLAREMGLLMQQNAVAGQKKGDTFAPLEKTNFQGGVMDGSKSILTPPVLQALKKAGLLEKILGAAGLGGSLIGAAGAFKGNSGGYRGMGDMAGGG